MVIEAGLPIDFVIVAADFFPLRPASVFRFVRARPRSCLPNCHVRRALARAPSALAIAFWRRPCSFALAASSFPRSFSRCFCSLSNASAASRPVLSSILRDGCFWCFARSFAGLPFTWTGDRCVGK
jgi:hypothetical protein